MRGFPIVLLLSTLVLGCGNKKGTDSDGLPDAPPDTTDTVEVLADIPDEVELECTEDEDCDDEDPCTTDTCNTDDNLCEHEPIDRDDDGFTAETAGGEDCGGTDCDDGDELVYPDSTERRCDEDADCNGHLDIDNDDDGHDSEACSGDDCNDEDEAINPSAVPGCETDTTAAHADLDCNGNVDGDNDDDGHFNMDCTSILDADDCDDTRADVYLDAPEVCFDGVDQDCDTLVDGALTISSTEERITSADDASVGPVIAWSGSEFGVAWADERDGNDEIYFARISSSGTKIGSDVRITDDGSTSESASLVWTSSEYGVAWQDDRDGNAEIYFARISASGAKVGSDTRITNATGASWRPVLAWTGSEYAVTWMDARTATAVYLARISSAGVKVGTDIAISASTGLAIDPHITWTGSQFGLAWHDTRSTGWNIYFSLASEAGVKVGSDIALTSGTTSASLAAIEWSGSEFGVSWQDMRGGQNQIYFLRLDATGTPVGTDARISNSSLASMGPGLAWSGSEFALTWTDQTTGPWAVYASILSPTGTETVDDFEVSFSSGWGQGSSIAWADSQFGIAWHDNRDGNTEIYWNTIQYCD